MIRVKLTLAIQGALKELGIDPDSVFSLERPAQLEHGDWASNVALATASKANQNPQKLAESLAEILNKSKPAYISKAEVAGPGFLNLHLSTDWLYEVLSDVVSLGEADFARHSFGAGQKIMVEFVSANPTGPLHAGHAKGAVWGDSLARVLDRCGYEVIREFYLNDMGSQVDLYVDSIKAHLEGMSPPEDGYKGSYIAEWAEELSQSSNTQDYKIWSLQKAQKDQEEVLSSLGIYFQNWFSESSIGETDQIPQVLQALEEKGVVYEKEGAVWLKTSEYGDDKDRVLVKSDGSMTYLLPDIVYHQDKLSRVGRIVNVWGADHHGYVARLRSALTALGEDPDRLDIIICQLVRLESQGEEIRISKRTGDIILLRDLVEMLGKDAVRFTFLLQSPDSAQTVDLETAASKSMENPVYYVQYAHTRICSILKKAEELKLKEPVRADLSLLSHPTELDLLRLLDDMAELVAQAAQDFAPHRLTNYLRELAGAFHSFYHNCRVMGEDVSLELSIARLELLKAVKIGLVVGLDLCGVDAPEKM